MNKEKTIQEIDTQEIVERIHSKDKSSFAVFLALELKERYNERPVEEQHMEFDHWRKLLMLREDKKNDVDKLRDAREAHQRWEKRRAEQQKPKKNSYEGVNIPEWMKQSPTRHLLSLRFSFDDNVDHTALYAELATREHIPNKLESKEKRRTAAKKKRKWINSRELHNLNKLSNGSNQESEQDS